MDQPFATLRTYDQLLGGDITVSLPEMAKITRTEVRDNRLLLTALVRPDFPPTTRTFRVYKAGEAIGRDVFPQLFHLGSDPEGRHVFEVVRIHSSEIR